MEIRVISNSPDETRELAKIFSRIIDFRDTIVLSGELGGGKTTFLNGMASSLGIKDDLASPSFTLVNLHNIAKDKTLVHIDLYRLDRPEDIFGTEIIDRILDDSSLTCIEWGEKITGYLKKDHLKISFSYILGEDIYEPDKREIIFTSFSPYWDKKLSMLGREVAL